MKRLLEFWDLIAGLIIVAFMFGSLQTTQHAQASRLDKFEAIKEDVTAIRVDVAEIKGQLKHIAEKGK